MEYLNSIIIVTTIEVLEGKSAGAARIKNYARGLNEHKVFICNPIDGIFNWSSNNLIKSVKHCRFITKTIFYYFYFLLEIVKIIKLNKLENVRFFIYPTTTTSLDFAVLILLKFILNYKILYEVNELRSAAIENRSYSNNFIVRLVELCINRVDMLNFYIVEKCTKYYDGLIVISENLKTRFSIYNMSIILIPVLVDENIAKKLNYKKKEYSQTEIFKIGFTGSLSIKKEGFDLVFETLSLLKKNHNVQLHLSGPISKNEIELILDILPKKLNIKQLIVYHGIIKQSDVLRFLKTMHLLILPRPRNKQTDFGLSTKMGEYLLSGVPTLVTNVSDNAIYIKDGINGFVVEPGSVIELINKIEYIILNYNLLNVQEEAIKTATNLFNIKNYSNSLNLFFNNV